MLVMTVVLAVHRISESSNPKVEGFYAEPQKYFQGLSDKVAIGALAIVTGRLNTLLRNGIKPLMLKKEQYISCYTQTANLLKIF